MATTVSSAQGGFALCGLPASTRITVRVQVDTDSLGIVELDVPESGVLLRDLFVSRRSTATRTSSTAESAFAGSVQSTKGIAIGGARISIRDAAEARTDSTGRFTLQAGWLGTRMVDVRAIGYQPRRFAVDLRAGSAPSLDVILSTFTNELALVRISASQWRDGFDQRRTKHLGMFVDGRLRVEGMENLDAIVQADDVQAVEVYRYAAEVPMQFLAPPSCGAILIWRRARNR